VANPFGSKGVRFSQDQQQHQVSQLATHLRLYTAVANQWEYAVDKRWTWTQEHHYNATVLWDTHQAVGRRLPIIRKTSWKWRCRYGLCRYRACQNGGCSSV